MELLPEAVVKKGRLDEEAARRARWEQLVGAKEKRLAMLERRGKGDTPQAEKLEDELEELYDNPVVAPLPEDDPPTHTPVPVDTSIATSPSQSLGDTADEGAAGDACQLQGVGEEVRDGTAGVGSLLPGFSGTISTPTATPKESTGEFVV